MTVRVVWPQLDLQLLRVRAALVLQPREPPDGPQRVGRRGIVRRHKAGKVDGKHRDLDARIGLAVAGQDDRDRVGDLRLDVLWLGNVRVASGPSALGRAPLLPRHDSSPCVCVWRSTLAGFFRESNPLREEEREFENEENRRDATDAGERHPGRTRIQCAADGDARATTRRRELGNSRTREPPR